MRNLFQSGDCCEPTCRDDVPGKSLFNCSSYGYSCRDPDVLANSDQIVGSCRARCGETFGSRKDGGVCFCDEVCEQEGNCCSDYQEFCQKEKAKECQVHFPDWLGDAQCDDGSTGYNTKVSILNYNRLYVFTTSLICYCKC